MKRSRILQLLMTVACMPAFAPANAGELADMLTAILDHPSIEAREHDVAAASRVLSAETARYLGSGQAMAESSRFEDKRIVGVYAPDASFTLRAELACRNEVVQLETEKHRLGAQTLENLLRHERDWLDTLFRLANAEAKATSAWSAAQVLMGTPVSE